MQIDLSEQGPASAARFSKLLTARAETHRSLLDNLPIGVFRITGEGRILEANTALATMFGYERVEQLLALDGEAVARAAGLDARNLRERLDAEGEVRGMAATWRNRLGSSLTVEIHARAVRDPQDPSRVLYYEGAVEDVSARKRAEQKLKERTIYLHALIENSPLAIVVLTPSHTVEMTNGAFTRLFGYRQREIVGRELDALIAPGEYAAEARRFSAQAHAGETIHATTRRRRRDGAWIDVELFGVPLVVDGRQIGALGIYQDVTGRRAQEEALRQSRAFFQQTLDSLTAHIAILDARGGIVATNAAWDRFARDNGGTGACLRANYLEVCDRAAAAGVEEAAAAARAIREVLAGDCETYELEYACDGPGQCRWFLLRVSRFAGDEPVRVVVSHEDITARKSLEQQLNQAQKMDAIGRLAGGVAHDFNNLLMVISGYAELLVDAFATGHPGRRQAEEIKRAADRATSLTRQLLAFSRKQVLRPQRLRLDAVIGEMEHMLRRLIPENVDIRWQLGAADAEIRADPGQLEQVVMNLAANAADAMPAGGRLRIQTRPVELDALFCRHDPDLAPGSYVELCVADTGSGMDAATRARIFEPFFTTKEPGKGTGLGLATVYGIVKQSNGTITVESEPNRGTTFRLYFPRASQSALAVPQVRPAVSLPQASETVLLVEDEDGVREMTRAFLVAQGYRVLAAGDGRQALGLAQQHSGPIHLLVTDVVMPGMGGLELAGHIRQTRPEVSVLFTSGYAEEAVAGNGAARDRARFLQKPYELRRLAEVIRSLLGEKAGAPAA